MRMKHAFSIGVVAAAAAMLPSAAEAAINITSVSLPDGAQTGVMTIDQPGPDYSTPNVYIGRIRLNGTDTVTSQAVSFSAYCIDIRDLLSNGLFDVLPLVSYAPLNATQKAQLLALVSNADPLLNAASKPANDISAAIQLAVWEIVYETGGTFDVGNGIFTANTAASAKTLANTYLANVTGGTWTAQAGYSLNTLVAQNQPNQEQLFLIATPVPEPATWAMMIGGFGLIGASLRMRRRQPLPARA